ncbi:sulfite exporter TauE/SafE family protein [Shewanella sp. OMA3-2]|uniref:sulfite exporter TauE/SafE family protein n=1 Tax=Shewanella sp. OMA3-2 TaxID=2908650 RepID=UPI001F2721CF|nr:sulfite exporter TauE/SafE family protein [Shewanella sp. OMA3-2]UJF20835.1 sulfite exporter TauE/SafE family protein [Shewanella sp. OMA3-2]
MLELTAIQYVLIALVFVWSGFVRSGLGFGGAVLSLPFLLLIDNQPLVYLPIIAVHLLIFSSATIGIRYLRGQQNITVQGNQARTRESHINWPYLKYTLSIVIVPKLIGVFGLLTLPTALMSGMIFVIVFAYSISYILNKPFVSKKPWLDVLFLMLGGYISGTSLIGAPLIIAVMANHVSKYQLRDTLFVLWFVLVAIKLSMFVYVGVDLQLKQHLWLLPCATVGHFIGLHFHQRILEGEQAKFYRLLGSVLLLISCIGLYQISKA